MRVDDEAVMGGVMGIAPSDKQRIVYRRRLMV